MLQSIKMEKSLYIHDDQIYLDISGNNVWSTEGLTWHLLLLIFRTTQFVSAFQIKLLK